MEYDEEDLQIFMATGVLIGLDTMLDWALKHDISAIKSLYEKASSAERQGIRMNANMKVFSDYYDIIEARINEGVTLAATKDEKLSIMWNNIKDYKAKFSKEVD